MDDGLLPDPGVLAGMPYQTVDTSTDFPNLPPLSIGTLTPPTTMADDSAYTGIFDPSAQSGSAADAVSDPSSGFNWDNLLGGLAQTGANLGLADAQALYVNPAIAQANNAATQAQLQNQLNLAAGTAAINTQSITTILIWGAIAWAVVTLLGSVERR